MHEPSLICISSSQQHFSVMMTIDVLDAHLANPVNFLQMPEKVNLESQSLPAISTLETPLEFAPSPQYIHCPL